MEPGTAVLLSVGLLVLLLVAGVSVAVSLASSGILGLLLLRDVSIVTNTLAGTSYTAVARASFIVVPMFILMGMLTLHSGIAQHLFAIASRLLRWLPGGLGIAAVTASAGFAAVTGSSVATVATLGRTCITEMMRHGYRRSFAAGIIGASGTLGVLIPPSIILVLYGIITGESIGALLIAGIIPGILSALLYGGAVAYRAVRHPELVTARDDAQLRVALGESNGARPGASAEPEPVAPTTTGPLTPGAVAYSVGGVAALFGIVIGGIYLGVFTPTESAALGAFAAFLLLTLRLCTRPRQLWASLSEALRETAALNSMVFLILVGAGVFSFFLVSAGVPSALSRTVVDLPLPPHLIVALLLLFMIPLGMFLDPISILVITVPLVYTPITDLGFEGIWLGILVVKLIEIGMITPPIGMNAYVVAGTTPGLQVEEVFRGLLPFVVIDLLTVALIFALPGLVLYLPGLMG